MHRNPFTRRRFSGVGGSFSISHSRWYVRLRFCPGVTF